jgi:hypothetical protein
VETPSVSLPRPQLTVTCAVPETVRPSGAVTVTFTL